MRPGDVSNEGFPDGWTIKSVHNWGENPNGEWKIEITVNVSN